MMVDHRHGAPHAGILRIGLGALLAGLAVEFDGTSDYAAFVDAWIPSAGLLAGDEQVKTAEQAAKWGGSAGQVVDDCYHTACDTLDDVDRTALDRFGDATAGTLASLAGSPA